MNSSRCNQNELEKHPILNTHVYAYIYIYIYIHTYIYSWEEDIDLHDSLKDVKTMIPKDIPFSMLAEQSILRLIFNYYYGAFFW